jgi:hypothetical protein
MPTARLRAEQTPPSPLVLVGMMGEIADSAGKPGRLSLRDILLEQIDDLGREVAAALLDHLANAIAKAV